MTALNRAEKKRQTRAILKKSALQCFEKMGVDATQVGAISKQASVAHGTFYVHFKDKGVLLDELLADFNEGFITSLTPLFIKNSKATAEQLIAPLAEMVLSHFESNPIYVQIYVNRMTQGAGDRQLREGVNPKVVEFLSDVIAKRFEMRADEAFLIVQGLLAMWIRIILQLLNNPQMNRQSVLNILISLTTGAVASLKN